ncbi:MAG: phage tail protein, partial [Cyanobacteria bacterium J06632_22]
LTRAKKIRSVFCPGLCTDTGQVPHDEATRQMAVAYDHFLHPPTVLNTFVVASRQLRIWEGK